MLLCRIGKLKSFHSDWFSAHSLHSIYVLHLRVHICHLHDPLFPSTEKKKFRGTHLMEGEEYYDNMEGDMDDIPAFAWSYGSAANKASKEIQKFEADLRTNAAKQFSPHSLFTGAEAELMREQAQAGVTFDDAGSDDDV